MKFLKVVDQPYLKKFLTSKKEKKNLQNNEILIPKGGGVVLYANCVGFEYKCVEHYLKQA